MRDPITKLAIVDGGSLDPELCRAFADVFMVPERLAVVHYVSVITKKSGFFGTNEKRVILISDQCAYICKENGQRRRCIRIRDISEVLCFSDSFVGLRIPAEYDMVLRLASAAELDYFLNILRVVQDVCYGRQLHVNGVKGTYKESGLNLSRPDNYVPTMVPFTFLSAPNANEDALDELLRPPPPPLLGPTAPSQPNLTPEAAVVLHHPLLDPNTVAPLAAAALKPALVSSVPRTQHESSSRADVGGDGGADVVEAQLRRLTALDEELRLRQAAQADAERRAAVMGHWDGSPDHAGGGGGGRPLLGSSNPPVTNDSLAIHSRSGAATPPPNASAYSAAGMSPIAASARDASALIGFAPSATTREASSSPKWSQQLPSKARPAHGGAADSQRVEELQAAVQQQQVAQTGALRNIEEQLATLRVDFLEAHRASSEQRQISDHISQRLAGLRTPVAEYEPLSRPSASSRPTTAAAHADDGVSDAVHQQFRASPTGKAEPAAGVRPLAASRSLSGGRSAVDVLRRGPSVAEFESTIGTRPLKERLVLRQYQIDEKRREIQRLFSDNGKLYDPIAVAALQDDLVALVKKLEADLVDVESQASSRAESPEPRAAQPAPAATVAEATAPQPPASALWPTMAMGWSDAAHQVSGGKNGAPVISGGFFPGGPAAAPQPAAALGAPSSSWEWTPERTAEYWAWVATMYHPPPGHHLVNGAATQLPHRGGPPGPGLTASHRDPHRNYGAPAAADARGRPPVPRTAAEDPAGMRRVLSGPRYQTATVSSVRHERRPVSPGPSARVAAAVSSNRRL